MAKLLYAAITSLDGYVADASGGFAWAAPDEAVHASVNDVERTVGTQLYGRRMYEVLEVWETMDVASEPDVIRDYAALWRAADKIVYSTTLSAPRTARTRVERTFDADAIRALKATAAKDLTIGGPTLAAAAFAAGLVDEVHEWVNPVIVGGGLRALPEMRVDLELLGERRFENGAVHLHYRTTADRPG